MKTIVLICALALCSAVKADSRYMCYLPRDPGSCSQFLKKYYYNVHSRTCRKFTFSGCGGNANNFDTRDECEQECSGGGYYDSACDQPLSTGDCDEYLERYYFNAQTGNCEPFTYAGCRGNTNNFRNETDCTQLCIVTQQYEDDD